jgi:D-arabinose 1-dehydrogenase-like Zn-dependent alcohol dehydrogenase
LLAGEWKPPAHALAAIVHTVSLAELDAAIEAMLRGAVRGRVVVLLD